MINKQQDYLTAMANYVKNDDRLCILNLMPEHQRGPPLAHASPPWNLPLSPCLTLCLLGSQSRDFKKVKALGSLYKQGYRDLKCLTEPNYSPMCSLYPKSF